MPRIFVDTSIWIAAANPREPRHAEVRECLAQPNYQFVTSELVCIEVLNFFGGRGGAARTAAVALVSSLRASATCEVLTLAQTPLGSALDLYGARADKEWSLIDCASMHVMRELSIDTALTLDHHFIQAGFKVLPGLPI